VKVEAKDGKEERSQLLPSLYIPVLWKLPVYSLNLSSLRLFPLLLLSLAALTFNGRLKGERERKCRTRNEGKVCFPLLGLE
jgi:hypothetical protein